DVKTIVPGHGPLGGYESFSHLKAYLWDLTQAVHRTLRVDFSERAAVAALQLDPKYRIPLWHPMSRLNPLLEHLRRLNEAALHRT
ncbi:MAG TPA: hypothetical protein VG168_11670, partial [Bryobacteraceae bacterium]|nr:hypothetical protein [Bryobacteraceae bacterium]